MTDFPHLTDEERARLGDAVARPWSRDAASWWAARLDAARSLVATVRAELVPWKDAAVSAWSLVTETAPEECPGPRAVREVVDALDDRCSAAVARAEKAEARSAQMIDPLVAQAMQDGPMSMLVEKTAELDAMRSTHERLAIACIGALTNAGHFLPVDGDPAEPSLIGRKIKALTSERDAAVARAEQVERELQHERDTPRYGEVEHARICGILGVARTPDDGVPCPPGVSEAVSVLRTQLAEARAAVEAVTRERDAMRANFEVNLEHQRGERRSIELLQEAAASEPERTRQAVDAAVREERAHADRLAAALVDAGHSQRSALHELRRATGDVLGPDGHVSPLAKPYVLAIQATDEALAAHAALRKAGT